MTDTQLLLDANLENINGPVPEPSSLEVKKYLKSWDKLEKYKLIKEILNKDDCFLNMNIEYAYAILRDLGVSEEKLKDVYLELI